ncbi:MAG TPA: BMP family ABC transporter substrate-binding protein [Lacisediminihabitans sp.]|nr:BMP family ABC transporter substrate-binding protein [Lacisediminihabitans sp.]HXD61897.1 BMP family ABC transporter substrate-binding protein [Lacisediminihabitans sp.]
MRITSRGRIMGGLAIVGIATMLAGCASAPTKSADSGAKASNFKACMVSDAGGFDDKSFNQLGLEGLQAAQKKLNIKEVHVQSTGDNDYVPNITQMIDQGCNLIVTVGFNLANATRDAAKANPKVNFALIDSGVSNDDQSPLTLPNVKPILSDTAQAAFLVGYAAASYSKTGVIGTFGGMQIPPVTIFMDGYADGAAYYNTQKGKNVQVKGWDVKAQNGSFTGGFDAGIDAEKAAQTLIDANADVILPVGGPIFQSAGAAIVSSGKDIALIGCDADVYETFPKYDDLYFTSIMKSVGVDVEDVVTKAAAGKFDNAPFIGTLENGGVSMAPFHKFESKVDPGLQKELDAIKADIISGKIKVESPSTPK